MTRSQSLGKEEAGLSGSREEEGTRRKDREAGAKQTICRPGIIGCGGRTHQGPPPQDF